MGGSKRFSQETRQQAVQLVCAEVGTVEAARAAAEAALVKGVERAIEGAKTKDEKAKIKNAGKAELAISEAAGHDSRRKIVKEVASKFGCTPSTLSKWVELYSESYDYEVVFRPDKNREELLEALKTLNLKDENFEAVHKWIYFRSIVRNERNAMVAAAKVSVLNVQTSEQVKECAQIARAASILVEHFGTPRKFGPSMYELSATYRDALSSCGYEAAMEWGTFANRILSHAELLKWVASETSERLKLKKRRTGAPSRTERNIMLTKWVDLLKRYTGGKVEDFYEPAMKGWNVYFKSSDRIMSVEQLKKALAAGRVEIGKKVRQKS